MGETRTRYSLMAPDHSDSGADSFPPLDEHLVKPKVTRDEIIGGRLVVSPPSEEAHANQHSHLNYVVRAHVAPGYRGAMYLLTRYDWDSDFASDVCVYRNGVDPATGERYLEEMTFLLVSEQKGHEASEKAPRMHRRGVRWIFAVFVEARQICEWCPESQSWSSLDSRSRIEDPCLVLPLAVDALFFGSDVDD
jgi:hypothetical protein